MKQHAWATTPATALFDIRFPIVQGPFGGGLSSVSLTSAVSGLGGLGSFGCQPYTPGEIVDIARAIRQETDKPFNLNLWVDDRDARLSRFDEAAYAHWQQTLQPYFDEAGIPMPAWPQDLGPRYEDQINAVLDTRPAVFSFVYGIPSADVLEQCRKNGTKTVGAATTVDEAVALDNAGVDAIVATGFEAGGHRVSFLAPAEDSLTGLFALVPQMVDRVSVPVIAAGGIADARGIKAALALGASAVQIGTAFLATDQSNAPPEHKEKLFSPSAQYTVLTTLLSGRLARGMRSQLIDELKDKAHLFAPYPLQGKLMAPLRAAFIRQQRPEYQTFWSGQSARLLAHHDASALFRSLVSETDSLYAADAKIGD
ncbi:MAG: nitronate monooxygenase [Rhizobacter sp.]